MEILVIAVALVLFAFSITKAKDADMQAKHEATPAPEWARVGFVLVVAVLLFGCIFLTAPAAMLGR